MPTKGLTKKLIDKFSILNGAKYFSSGIFQNYLVFIPAKKKEENFENITISDSNFCWSLFITNINFNGHCLINYNFIPKNVINLYICYTLSPWLRNLITDFTLKNSSF